VCQNCSKFAQPHALYAKGEIIGPDGCESLDCAVFYQRARLVSRLEDCQVSVLEATASADAAVAASAAAIESSAATTLLVDW
jgi:hypothetical protein